MTTQSRWNDKQVLIFVLYVRQEQCSCRSLSINLKVYSFVGYAAFSVFPLTCAAEKHLVSEKPQNIAVFQGHRGGIGGDRAQSENL